MTFPTANLEFERAWKHPKTRSGLHTASGFMDAPPIGLYQCSPVQHILVPAGTRPVSGGAQFQAGVVRSVCRGITENPVFFGPGISLDLMKVVPIENIRLETPPPPGARARNVALAGSPASAET